MNERIEKIPLLDGFFIQLTQKFEIFQIVFVIS